MYLMGTEDYGISLPYAKGQNSKLDEVFGKDVPGDEKHSLEIWSDSDWAGDKSSTKTRRHSVSSVMIFLNRCPLVWACHVLTQSSHSALNVHSILGQV